MISVYCWFSFMVFCFWEIVGVLDLADFEADRVGLSFVVPWGFELAAGGVLVAVFDLAGLATGVLAAADLATGVLAAADLATGVLAAADLATGVLAAADLATGVLAGVTRAVEDVWI
jgi:hypothetical protein